jgi:hypothetical protein
VSPSSVLERVRSPSRLKRFCCPQCEKTFSAWKLCFAHLFGFGHFNVMSHILAPADEQVLLTRCDSGHPDFGVPFFASAAASNSG